MGKAVSKSEPPGRADLKWAMLAAFYFLATISAMSRTAEAPGWVELVARMFSGAFAVCWMVLDCRGKHPMPHGVQLFAWVTLPLFLPGYLIWSRGWRGLGWLMLNMLLLGIVEAVAMVVSGKTL